MIFEGVKCPRGLVPRDQGLPFPWEQQGGRQSMGLDIKVEERCPTQLLTGFIFPSRCFSQSKSQLKMEPHLRDGIVIPT